MKLKTTLFLLLITTLLCGCITFSEKSLKYLSIVQISDTAFFDQTEVDVASWLSYYTWKRQHEGFEAAQKVLPDSMAVEPEVWTYMNHNTCPPLTYIGNYSSQPIGNYCEKCDEFIEYDKKLLGSGDCPFLNFPITGVTYEQVTDFCLWRTKIQGNGELAYRLPTNREWMDFANKGLTESQRKNGITDSITENCKLFNYRLDNVKCNLSKYGVTQVRTSSFAPSLTKAYDVFGSVSEMTAVKGESKGGNYKTSASESRIDSIQYYTQPEVWLGFRCIAFKINSKK